MASATTQNRRQPNAAQVSRALSLAGHTKASPYSPFGRDLDGFQVTRIDDTDGAIVRVLNTRNYLDARRVDELEAYAQTLEAAGFRIERDRTPQTRRLHGLTLLRWETTNR
jgi:hypothetical protein